MSKAEQKPEVICDYEIHPAASVFPLMEGERFQALVDSIAVHGVQNPLVCSGHVVIDGRNRLRAVMRLRDEGHKVELPFVEWDGVNEKMSVAEWIEAQNLDRRHLSDEAYAAASAALMRMARNEAKARARANLKQGNPAGRKATKSESPVSGTRDHRQKHEQSTAGKLAKKTGVSRHKAEQALKLDKAVQEGTVPVEVQRDVIAGKRKLKDAVSLADAFDPMAAIVRDQRAQRKKRGTTKQSENARLERKLMTLMVDIRRTVETLAENTSKQSNRRKGIADELRRLAKILTPEGASA